MRKLIHHKIFNVYGSDTTSATHTYIHVHAPYSLPVTTPMTHTHRISYLTKEGVFLVQFICSAKSDEELATVIIRLSICHSNQATATELESRVKFILRME